jgi:hypothetical protein
MADLILYNANIITLDSDIENAQLVAIGNGRIQVVAGDAALKNLKHIVVERRYYRDFVIRISIFGLRLRNRRHWMCRLRPMCIPFRIYKTEFAEIPNSLHPEIG